MENKIIKSDCCEVIADASKLTRDEWLSVRQTGFGGSDSGGIMIIDGKPLSKYNAPFTIVHSKLHEPKEIDNKHTRYGNRMEKVLRSWCQEDNPDWAVFESKYVYRSIEHPFMIANIDGFIVSEKGYKGLEIKTASEFNKADWEDGNIPDDYYSQCQHYMAVLGFQEWEIQAQVGKDTIYYTVKRNDKFIEDLISAEKNLWYEFVQKKQYPMLLGLDCEDSIVDEIHNSTVDGSVELGEEVNKLSIKRYDISQQIKKLEDEKKKLSIQIKDAVGDYKKGQTKFFNVSYIRSSKKTFNKGRFEKEHPALFQEYVGSTDYTQLRVNPNKVYKEMIAV